jgi:simple sugar transport system ATP-binding protein
MVLLHHIKKRFAANGVQALDGAEFELRDGEIHALAGENGAGKSTLMQILAGFFKADEGIILLDGQERKFSSPAKALAAGIGMVRQHPRLVPEFSVWENCILGSEGGFRIAGRRHLKEVAALDEKWRFNLPLEKTAAELTVSEGQKAAILALLRRNVRYFIFDEPTAVLSPAEAENLFALFQALRDDGKGVILITHKLGEIATYADRVTVLRGGKTAAVLDEDEIDETKLSELIFGTREKFPTKNTNETKLTKKFTENELVLELKNFSVNVAGRPLIRGVDLAVRRGEIVGIAGVRDSGLETLELAAAGFLPSSGTLAVNGSALADRLRGEAGCIAAFRAAGGAYLGTADETIAPLSVRDILIIHAHRRFQKWGILDSKKLAAWSKRLIKGAGIEERSAADGSDLVPASSFSGGQLQKILFIRELAEKTPLLILAEPGRGLDRKSRGKLARLLRGRADEGAGILLFSTDNDELLAVCDEVHILRNGRFEP